MRTAPIRNVLQFLFILVFPLAWAWPGSAAKLPEVDGVEAIASVNGEAISLDELFQQLAKGHQELEQPEERVKGADPRVVLDRLINVRLILQEARNIGLDELPGIPDQVAALRLELIRDAVVEEQIKDITRGDPEQAERLYREAVREAYVESALFSSEEAAASFLAAVEGGVEFGQEAARLVVLEEALAYQAPESLQIPRMQPPVAAAVLALEPGGVSAPISLDDGVAVVRLIELRYPDDPEARAQAEQQALSRRQQEVLGEYAIGLRKKYATVDEELLESLGYDNPDTDLDALRNDARPIAKIRGGEPITVGELTARIEKKMFHGLERAVEQGRAAESAPVILDRIIQERAVLMEAKRLGIEERPEFRRALREREEGLIFGTFVSKVIDSKVKLSDEELQAFLAEHADEYSSPEMMGIESLVFRRREDAQSALEKLRQGADLKWMRANAVGQIDPEEVDPEWRFDGTVLPVPGLPEAVREAVVGAVGGDYRFCEQPGGKAFHVLWVMRQFAPHPQEYEEIREKLAVRVFARKRQQALDDWMARLRKASDLEVYAEDDELRELLGLGSAEGR
jgi:parvulin-like peptidyl-prolyl isomerase